MGNAVNTAEAATSDTTTLQGSTQDGGATEVADAGNDSQPESAKDSAATAAPEEPKSREELEKSAMGAILKKEEEGRLTSFAVPEDDAAAKPAPKKEQAQATPATEDGGKAKEKDQGESNEAKRIKAAQKAFHESRAEVARLQKRIEELEGKKDGNSGAESSDAAADVLEGLDLPAETKASLKEMPELNALAKAILKSTGGSIAQEKKADAQRALAEAQERNKTQEVELSKQWEEGVKAEYPDYQETFSSTEFQDWKASHPATVKGILEKCDQFDPEGAINVIRAFKSGVQTKRDLDQSRTRGQDTASRPGKATRSVVPPSSDGGEPRKKSIRELEAESMAAILREERAKRRSF